MIIKNDITTYILWYDHINEYFYILYYLNNESCEQIARTKEREVGSRKFDRKSKGIKVEVRFSICTQEHLVRA